MSSGNGKAGTRREAFAHNEAARERALTQQERALAALEGSEWDDEVTENHFHLPKGTTLEADRTGRLRAVSNPDDEITLTENPAPKQPDSTPAKAKFALAVLDRLPAGWRGPVVIVALGLVGVALWRGGSLAGLWP